LLDARTAAEEDVDDLLEIEEPEGQVEVPRADDIGQVAEAAAIFVVRIDQKNAQIRLLRQDLLQDEGDAGRLADAGRAEDGEVLAEELLEIDVGGDGVVELQPADLDGLAVADVVDEAKLGAGERRHAVADRGIFGDAAIEESLLGGGVLDLAEEINVS